MAFCHLRNRSLLVRKDSTYRFLRLGVGERNEWLGSNGVEALHESETRLGAVHMPLIAAKFICSIDIVASNRIYHANDSMKKTLCFISGRY